MAARKKLNFEGAMNRQLRVAAAHPAGLQRKHRADPLPSGQQGVLHSLLKIGVPDLLAEYAGEIFRNHILGQREILCGQIAAVDAAWYQGAEFREILTVLAQAYPGAPSDSRK